MADPRFEGINTEMKWLKSVNGVKMERVEKLSGGTSTSDYMATAAPDQKFLNFYCQTTATSGDCRLFYGYMDFHGAGTGGGEVIRAYASITAAYTSSTINGAHICAEIGASGSHTGMVNAAKLTLQSTAATRTMAGVKSALNLVSWFGAGTTLGGEESFIRFDDLTTSIPMTLAFDFGGLTAGSGKATVAGSHSGTTVGYVLRVRTPDGAIGYIKIFSD
jgi:hypothetical protein